MWNQLLLSGRNDSGDFRGIDTIYQILYILVKTILKELLVFAFEYFASVCVTSKGAASEVGKFEAIHR